jgi:adenine-specific DNA methylase
VRYPKRLIEVDLPIKRISAHARREKSIRHGHISTLHIWWARRPLAACRAVICAALWPDPADPGCPVAFRKTAERIILDFARKITSDTKLANDHCSPENFKLWQELASLQPSGFSLQPLPLRSALLDFIADFANWDNSTVREYLDTARLLTAVAHNSLSDPKFKLPPEGPDFLSTINHQLSTAPKPLVVDPFCGGGSIPLEALRVGADAFASDLNPIPVLLNKVVLEYIPKYGQRLADEVRKWGAWIRQEAEKELAAFYLQDLVCPEEMKGKPFHLLTVTGDSIGTTFYGDMEKDLREMTPVPGQRYYYQPTKGVPSMTGAVASAMDVGLVLKLKDPGFEKELADRGFKPVPMATPIAYLWARTIQCEGPGCGAEVPLMRSLWLAKTGGRSVALQLVPRPRAKRVDFDIIVKQRGGWASQDNTKEKIADPKFDGTVARGSATCPCCGYTTQVARVREQFKTRHGGANDARLLCVVTIRQNEQGRFYRLPTDTDLHAVRQATAELARRKKAHKGKLSLSPDEPISQDELRRISIPLYGMASWGDVFSNRQSLLLQTLARLGCEASKRAEPGISDVLTVLFALALGRQADACSSLARWHTTGEKNTGTFGRQALGMVWDFSEINPFSGSTGGWEGVVQWIAKVCESQAEGDGQNHGQAQRASATAHPLADDIASAWITDPPYYDAVPYAHLSDYFYVWLRRMLHDSQPELFGFQCVPKEEEVVVDRPHSLSQSHKDVAFYERELTKAFAEGRRVLRPDGIGTIVFASKTTASWEAILKAVVDAGWIITGSWPIDTEMEARVAAQGQARLASSVHLVCRPRENPDGSVRTDEVGDWRDVLAELPRRIHDWMPRLAEEGVVGADAIFACLGPALEVFSRYSRVEKASGETVTLSEYLIQVWAAVAKEALTMIFTGADATGFEEDARLTAMWLWTLKTDEPAKNAKDGKKEEDGAADADDGVSRPLASLAGFTLEFDAARKIAQGLGAHLEDLASLVAVEGETARLLPVAERANHLFGKDEGKAAPIRRKRGPQMELFKAVQDTTQAEATFGETKVEKVGATVLDRVHQSMILFAAGRSEALKRFLVEDGAGNNTRFWTLAQALSALYSASTDEKRWVDGVLARKKGLGF